MSDTFSLHTQHTKVSDTFSVYNTIHQRERKASKHQNHTLQPQIYVVSKRGMQLFNVTMQCGFGWSKNCLPFFAAAKVKLSRPCTEFAATDLCLKNTRCLQLQTCVWKMHAVCATNLCLKNACCLQLQICVWKMHVVCSYKFVWKVHVVCSYKSVFQKCTRFAAKTCTRCTTTRLCL